MNIAPIKTTAPSMKGNLYLFRRMPYHNTKAYIKGADGIYYLDEAANIMPYRKKIANAPFIKDLLSKFDVFVNMFETFDLTALKPGVKYNQINVYTLDKPNNLETQWEFRGIRTYDDMARKEYIYTPSIDIALKKLEKGEWTWKFGNLLPASALNTSKKESSSIAKNSLWDKLSKAIGKIFS